jgi:hypothetical protein
MHPKCLMNKHNRSLYFAHKTMQWSVDGFPSVCDSTLHSYVVIIHIQLVEGEKENTEERCMHLKSLGVEVAYILPASTSQ